MARYVLLLIMAASASLPLQLATQQRPASDYSAAIRRMKVIVDSLNQTVDQEAYRRPSWTGGGTADQPKSGLDSAYIHAAGIKIPTPVLALIGAIQGFPQGNYDEELRARQLSDMRGDIWRSTERAQSLALFKHLRELREHKNAKRDAEEQRGAQDTVRAVP